MRLSSKQRAILSLFYEHNELTKKQIVEEFGHWYYRNEAKHLGDVLTRMVNKRLIHRIKKGVYHIGPQKSSEAPNLFNQKNIQP